eukprot:352048-Chlamydomonas_euryale.AAC.3
MLGVRPDIIKSPFRHRRRIACLLSNHGPVRAAHRSRRGHARTRACRPDRPASARAVGRPQQGPHPHRSGGRHGQGLRTPPTFPLAAQRDIALCPSSGRAPRASSGGRDARYGIPQKPGRRTVRVPWQRARATTMGQMRVFAAGARVPGRG